MCTIVNLLLSYRVDVLQEEQSVITYGLVVEIDRHKETKKVTLKSPVAVRVILHHYRMFIIIIL